MEAQVTTGKRRYRPLYKTLTVGTNQYAVVDPDVAHRQADRHYKRALDLIRQNQRARDMAAADKITDALLLATDLGSQAAPMLLAQRALAGIDKQQVPQGDILVFLRLAADRQHADAAYQLGCSYALTGNFTQIETLLAAQTPRVDDEERQRLAIHYLMLAVDQQHAAAIEVLILAYAYGRAFIRKDLNQFASLCTTLIRRGNQDVALGFGAWLLGMTVEGELPLAGAVDLEQNAALGLRYLLAASRGGDMSLAQHALHLVCLSVERGIWGQELKNSSLKRRLIEEALAGNQLLAFYLMWYSVAPARRPTLPEFMRQCHCDALADVITPCPQRAVHYFEIAVKGEKEAISNVARGLSRYVFSGYIDALNSLKVVP